MSSDALIDALLALPFDTLVDMGCGEGAFLFELALRLPGARYIGVDAVARSVENARQRVPPDMGMRIHLLAEDCRHTSLAPESVDVVVYRMLLHHLDDIADALREAQRILRPGGWLVVRDGELLEAAAYASMNAELRAQGLPEEPRPGVALPELRALLERFAFTVRSATDVGEATFATPPYTSCVYASRAFLLVAQRGT